MRTTGAPHTMDHPLVWQTLAALLMAAGLVGIPTPVAAEAKKEPPALHPVSPAVHGLLTHSAPAGHSIRLAPPPKPAKPVRRLTPLRKQMTGLPKRNLQVARQQAALARRLLASRLPPADRPQKPRVLEGWQIRSIDGDTFAVGHERFRIRGLNAPESNEAGGFSASQRLDLLLHGGPVLVIPYGQDTYGRTLVEVYVNDRNVAEVMKEEGHDKRR